jgi:hypothetical protein
MKIYLLWFVDSKLLRFFLTIWYLLYGPFVKIFSSCSMTRELRLLFWVFNFDLNGLKVGVFGVFDVHFCCPQILWWMMRRGEILTHTHTHTHTPLKSSQTRQDYETNCDSCISFWRTKLLLLKLTVKKIKKIEIDNSNQRGCTDCENKQLESSRIPNC